MDFPASGLEDQWTGCRLRIYRLAYQMGSQRRTTMITTETVWARIREHAGETFRQIRGGAFTFSVNSNYLQLDRTNRRIPKSDIAKALALVPLENTTPVQRLQAPSYIYAILMDP